MRNLNNTNTEMSTNFKKIISAIVVLSFFIVVFSFSVLVSSRNVDYDVCEANISLCSSSKDKTFI